MFNETKHENAKGEILRFEPRKPEISLKFFNKVNQDPATLCRALTWSSKKEHKADALAPEAEEGRDKLR